MKRHVLVFTTLVALASFTLLYTNSSTGAQPATIAVRREAHPKIRAAIAALEAAKAEMKTAAHDFGGHREAAIKECEAAIEQLKIALQFDKK